MKYARPPDNEDPHGDSVGHLSPAQRRLRRLAYLGLVSSAPTGPYTDTSWTAHTGSTLNPACVAMLFPAIRGTNLGVGMRGKRDKKAPTDELTPYEAAIWRTVAINQSIDHGVMGKFPQVPTHFPLQLGGDRERVFATGPFQLRDYIALGDGSYMHQSGMMFATGAAGLALTGAFAVGQAIGNSSRRSHAEAMATPQWHVIDQGQVFVSGAGFYLDTGRNLFPWGFRSIHSARLVKPGAALINGESRQGPIAWIVESDWAELIFTLWARLIHPNHPQFAGNAWIPPGWSDRARTSKYGLPRPPTR